MPTIIVGIILASYAYRRGLRPRVSETVAPLFEGRHGRVYAGFTKLLGLGIAALSQRPDWKWGSDLAIGVGTWFWMKNAGFKQTGEVAQQISVVIDDAVQRARQAWGIAFEIWLAVVLFIPSVLIWVLRPDDSRSVGVVGVLFFLAGQEKYTTEAVLQRYRSKVDGRGGEAAGICATILRSNRVYFSFGEYPA